VYIGFETPNTESLIECGKLQNLRYDIVNATRKLHQRGLKVIGSFMLGFDNDSPDVFDAMIDVIQKSGIIIASVYLVSCLPGTRLHSRLKGEDRLLYDEAGGHFEHSVNFITKMENQLLYNGYKKVVSTIYSSKNHYDRMITFLKDYKPVQLTGFKLRYLKYVVKGVTSMFIFGFKVKDKFMYWKVILWCLLRRPQLFLLAGVLAINGSHYRRYYEQTL